MKLYIGFEGSGSHREYSISPNWVITPPNGRYHVTYVQFDMLHHQKRGDTAREIGKFQVSRFDAEQLVRLGTALRDIFDTLDRYNHAFGYEAPIYSLPEGKEIALVEQALRESRPIGEMESIE